MSTSVTEVRVWDAKSGAELASFPVHTGGIRHVAWSLYGPRIVSMSNTEMLVWDAASGAVLLRFRGDFWAVSLSPDGNRIVSAMKDHVVRMWDAASGVELACLSGHTEEVTHVAWSPDGRRIVGASYHTTSVWDTMTKICLETMEGGRDIAAIAAAGELGFQWRVRTLPFSLHRGLEMVIESAIGGIPIAWFPEAFDKFGAHPPGRHLAGSRTDHLYIVELEGEAMAIPPDTPR